MTDRRDAQVPPDERKHLAEGFGALLAEQRHYAGFGSTELARAAGMSAGIIGRYERGEIRPRADAITLLSLLLRRPQMPPDARIGIDRPDASAAIELDRQLQAAAGDSLRAPLQRSRRRINAINLLTRTGMTPAEFAAGQAAKYLDLADRTANRLGPDHPHAKTYRQAADRLALAARGD